MCADRLSAQEYTEYAGQVSIEESLGITESKESSISPFEECKTCKPQREPSEILWIPTIGLGIWYWRKRRKENLATEEIAGEGTDESAGESAFEMGSGNVTPNSNSNPYSSGDSSDGPSGHSG